MQQGIQAIDTRAGRAGRVRVVSANGWMVTGLAVVAACVATAGVITASQAGAGSAGVRTRTPAAGTSVLAGPAESVSAATATRLLSTAPGIVIADENSLTDVSEAAIVARHVNAPLLLMSPAGSARQSAALDAAVRGLRPTAVMGVGLTQRQLSAALPGTRVVTSPAGLPVAAGVGAQHGLAVLVHSASTGANAALAIAAAATARAAGATVVRLPGYDPRASAAAIRTLAATRPSRVLGVGTGFGTARLLSARVAVAETGTQLPGGGQVLFPMRKIVALYGTPGTPALGALGQQGLAASIARAVRTAASYRALSRVPVIPAFEIIATVAQASPGPDRTYSYQTPVAALRPWVTAATKAGLYVTLDLQPGRANLLAQAKRYQSLLRLPNVGLALDPEWKLAPGQLPLRQIGSVRVSEVNSVVRWLARLTARYRLPQKLLELHEFRLTMISGIQRLDTRNDDLAIVINMDGQGAPGTKQATWDAVVANAPKGVFFGWKDFYVKDTPMLGPVRTIRRHPVPVLISYQ